MLTKHKIVIGVTGASGAIYAKVLFDKLLQINEQWDKVGVVMSKNAKEVWRLELGNDGYANYPFDFYEANNFYAPFASGSARYNCLIVAPCSMGTMARISSGVSNDLICRAADVMLKERRKLILLVRDTPYNLIHLQNMTRLTEAGGIICPASPSFYSLPENFEELAATVTDRALDLAGFDISSFRWQSES